MNYKKIYEIAKKIYEEDDGFFLGDLVIDDLDILICSIIETLQGDGTLSVDIESEAFTEIRLTNIVDAYSKIYDLSEDIDDIASEVYSYLLYVNFPGSTLFNRGIKIENHLGKIIILYAIILRLVDENLNKAHNRIKFILHDDDIVRDMAFAEEYKTFKYHYLRERTYELMRLNQELFGHTSYDHIIGVNNLSYALASKLIDKGIKVDLGIVCGAALCHDIGKYACDKSVDNVAKIHYYFTDKWFEHRKLDYMRNIAVNHSTWDLELENLSIESLVLILSDFMVKKEKKSGNIGFFTLDESFQIVLEKLEDMNKEKEERYRRVFLKLKDFEEFLKSLEIVISIDDKVLLGESRVKQSVHTTIKILSLRHNIEVMHELRSLESINKMMKQALDMTDNEGIINRLRIIEEYCNYLTPSQKKSVTEYIFDFLYNPNERIREIAASITSKIIYHYHTGFRKWIPEREKFKYKKEQYERINLLNNLFLKAQGLYGIISNSKYTLLCRSVGTVIGGVGDLCNSEVSLFGDEEDNNIISFIEKLIDSEQEDRKTVMIRIEILSNLVDNRLFTLKTISRLIKIIESSEIISDPEIVNYAWYLLKEGLEKNKLDSSILNNIKSLKIEDESGDYILQSYLYAVINNVALNEEYELKNSIVADLKSKTRRIFLSNLKSTTSKTEKLVNIDVLVELSYFFEDFDLTYLGLHLINLIRINKDEIIRTKAGEGLCSLVERLEVEMTNDIVIELFKSFESDEYEFVTKIADYLGYIAMFLPFEEYMELFETEVHSFKIGSKNKKLLILDFIMSILINSAKKNNHIESEILTQSMKIIFLGLSDDIEIVRHHSFKIITHGIFGSDDLSTEDKLNIYKIYGKKLTMLIMELYSFKENIIISLSGNINILYRFISNIMFLGHNLDFYEFDKIALYSGAFDPISNGQKNVIKKISSMGYEVNIQLNEFVWNRSVQPYNHRKNMVELTIAQYNNIFVIPTEETYNLGVRDEVIRLIHNFVGKDLFILIGEDDLINNTLYISGDEAVYDINHIVIRRGNTKASDKLLIEEYLKKFKYYELIDMSSDESSSISPMSIRSGVDKKYDLSDYLDVRVAGYIKKHGLYVREPNLKGDVAYKSLRFIKKVEKNQVSIEASNRHIGSILWHIDFKIDKSLDLDSIEVSNILIKDGYKSLINISMMMSELILYAVDMGTKSIKILKNSINDESLLCFIKLTGFKENHLDYSLSIDKLAIVLLDFKGRLKTGALSPNRFILNGIDEFRKKMLSGLTDMFTDRTILLISNYQIEGHILDTLEIKQDKNHMVLGISDLFRKGIVSEFTTKNLDISERYDLESSNTLIEAENGYMPIDNQIEIIKRFYKEIYLISVSLGIIGGSQNIISTVTNMGLNIDEAISFISSEQVDSLLIKSGVSTDSNYHVHNDTIIIRESSLIPFAGGIPVSDSYGFDKWCLYNIYPYCINKPFEVESFKFLKFSQDMLKQTIRLYRIIEKEYEKISGKGINVSELNKVFNEICYPYINTYIAFEEDFSIIDFLEEELNKVQRSSVN